MSRILRAGAAATALSLILVSCNSSPEPATSIAISSPPTSATAAPTTSLPTESTIEASSPLPARLGVGDSRYPELGNGGYDATHYSVDLTFDPEPGTINALVEIEATTTEALGEFSLDFAGFEIDAVTVNEVDATFTREEGELIVTTPASLPAGTAFTAAVHYHGIPEPTQSQAAPFLVGWRTDPAGTAYVIGEPDGGRRWLPVNDHPSDKATYTFMITVPDPLTAAANGVLVDRITDLGWSTWVWESASPMASYLATVVVGNLEVIDDQVATEAAGIPIRNVLPPDVADSPPAALSTQGEMVAFFSDVFGPYPFQTYGITVVGDFEGALENQTLSIFSRDFIDSPAFLETVLAHELAHQWFGDSVSPADWGDIWLNEGFATYAELLWLEHTVGEAALNATVEGTRNELALMHLPPPGDPPADDLFNISVYQWGGLALHALRKTVGDQAFFDILRTYSDRFQHSAVTTEDFIAIAEEVSGQELDNLFAEWLYSDTIPELP